MNLISTRYYYSRDGGERKEILNIKNQSEKIYIKNTKMTDEEGNDSMLGLLGAGFGEVFQPVFREGGR